MGLADRSGDAVLPDRRTGLDRTAQLARRVGVHRLCIDLDSRADRPAAGPVHAPRATHGLRSTDHVDGSVLEHNGQPVDAPGPRAPGLLPRPNQQSPHGGPATTPGRLRPLGAAALALSGAVILALALYYDPIGERQKGRVMFDEFHRVDMPDSGVHGWEPTDTTFNTEDYGHNASYTYCILYDYLDHFYNVSRLTTKLDDQTLAACDVFVLKVPTAKLEPTEVTALTKFVAHGGGLMLIGEHTDVFGTGTYLNDVARRFGFRFRYDCLFDIDQLFQERYRPDVVPHPIVQNLPELDWAVSCSIEPLPVYFADLEFPLQFNSGRGAMVATGLRNLPADYHASNFYPQVEHVDRAGRTLRIVRADVGAAALCLAGSLASPTRLNSRISACLIPENPSCFWE